MYRHSLACAEKLANACDKVELGLHGNVHLPIQNGKGNIADLMLPTVARFIL